MPYDRRGGKENQKAEEATIHKIRTTVKTRGRTPHSYIAAQLQCRLFVATGLFLQPIKYLVIQRNTREREV